MSLSNRFPIKRVLLGVGGIALAVVAVAAAADDTDSGAPVRSDQYFTSQPYGCV